MRAKIQKWGNSLAVRIPKALADEVGLDTDSSVEVRIINGHIHIVPLKEKRYELDALLSAITEDNLHGEVDTGPDVGNEGW